MLIELSGSGDQQNTIQGASYLQDIGDWHEKNVSGTMVIQGRMLREIRLGSKTDNIQISISALTISNCVSLQKLLLSNIRTLGGTLNLSACTHLKEVYADGTALAQMKLPTGGGLQVVEYSANNKYLNLSNYPLMANEGVGINLCRSVISDFFITDCPLMRPIEILMEIMNAQASQTDHALKRIRVVGFEETYDSHIVLDKLAELANGTYTGLSSDGLAGEDEYPVLDGTLNVYANVYQDSIDALKETFKRLSLNIIGNYYVRFRDNIALQIVAKAYGDGIGVTKEQMAVEEEKCRLFFNGNTDIKSFDEFRYITGFKDFRYYNMFGGCTSLESVMLPDQVKRISYGAFNGCTSLSSVRLPKQLEVLETSVFDGCKSLSNIELPKGLKVIWNNAFRKTSLTTIELPYALEELRGQCFRETLLEQVTIPKNVNLIQGMAFVNCNKLNTVIFEPITPPNNDENGLIFSGTAKELKIYVPDQSIELYKVAKGFSAYAKIIYPSSSLTD